MASLFSGHANQLPLLAKTHRAGAVPEAGSNPLEHDGPSQGQGPLICGNQAGWDVQNVVSLERSAFPRRPPTRYVFSILEVVLAK